MKRLFLCLAMFIGCSAPIMDGIVTNKYFDPAHDTACPMCMGAGTRYDLTLEMMMPCMYCGMSGVQKIPDRYYIGIQGDDDRRATEQIGKSTYDAMNIGDRFHRSR